MSLDGCGAPQQTSTAVAEDTDQVVVTGKVRAGSAAVGGAFVRLLDASGEFTAEVVSSPEGDFRFYAAPGSWTVRALHREGKGQSDVAASGPGVHPVDIAVA
ncbi:MAG: DUF1416 domain-containing protein [Saccharopolyspora sp.]|uniref:DUF1416 domain-containing protein n=1 Tax=Saccharopolyspora TaxID=1835 RepID=UPI00190BCECD|nr:MULTISPECIES: DUF1416 domain-containing protein [unclassified Saccharopolyspora]MBK0866101.1 DUF1416 domain-containing protein [Saccharopolyspora sp. HNM0986]MBQ6644487.1 DUF1416 domain-containing protein [Saccharopolyspora sp.]